MPNSPQFRHMIPRVAGLSATLSAALLLHGCMAVDTSRGAATYSTAPTIGQAWEGNVYNRERTTYFNPRWSIDPDSHPAVRPVAAAGADGHAAYPPVSTRTAAEVRADGQVAGGLVGALIGAQAGNRGAGIVAGSAIGALAGGRLADPCQPGANPGSLWGALAGGVFGSLFGGGRGRDFWTALGAAGGAIRGTEMGAEGRRCR